jgi:hypothetical protein
MKIIQDTSQIKFRLSLGGMAPVNKVEMELQKSIVVFPNPVTNTLHIEFTDPSTANTKLDIYDPMSRKVKIFFLSGFEKNIALPLGDLPTGAYFIKFDGNIYKIYVIK